MDRRDWHIIKGIGIGELVTALTVACSVIWYGSQFQGRLDAQEAAQHRLEQTIIEQRQFVERQRGEDRSEMQTRLARMEDKLDRISDRVGAKL